jgi:hypothetical protein
MGTRMSNRSDDKAELFRRATEKNRLRRGAALPLLAIREEMEREASRLAAIAYVEECEKYQHVYNALYEKARSELRVEHGRDLHLSSGGQVAIRHRAYSMFRDFLAAQGIVEPRLKGVTVGADNRK